MPCPIGVIRYGSFVFGLSSNVKVSNRSGPLSLRRCCDLDSSGLSLPVGSAALDGSDVAGEVGGWGIFRFGG